MRELAFLVCGIVLGVVIGYLLGVAQYREPRYVVFERDEKGRIIGIHRVI